MAKIILNRINFSRKINNALTRPKFAGLAANAANTRFVFAKSNTMREFENDEITQELRAGAKATDSVLDYGNLTAWLGLSDGNAAAAGVRFYLESNLNFDKKGSVQVVTYGI